MKSTLFNAPFLYRVAAVGAAIFACVLFLFGPEVQAQLPLGEKTTLTFATQAEGRAVLMERDDFVRRMSPFDRAARLKTDGDVSEDEYVAFVKSSVLEWSETERKSFTAACEEIRPALEAFKLPLPTTVLAVKTNGKEEGGAAYTRGDAIVFPQGELNGRTPDLQRKIAHELFHVLSRRNPALRETLYAAIGFVKCDELPFPAELQNRKITNPDAPVNDHCIRLEVGGQERWAIPILFAQSEKYDTSRGGEFFNYLQFRLLLVDRDEAGAKVEPLREGGKLKLISPAEAKGFTEQIGRNTGYVIHPQEVLADNFVLLVLGNRNVPSPEVLQKMERVLREHAPESRR